MSPFKRRLVIDHRVRFKNTRFVCETQDIEKKDAFLQYFLSVMLCGEWGVPQQVHAEPLLCTD